MRGGQNGRKYPVRQLCHINLHDTRHFITLIRCSEPMGSIQRHNCRYRPCNLPRTPRRTYHSFQYPTNNYTYESPSSQSPTTPPPVIETIRHPYRIGLTKPIVRVPVSEPIVVPAHQAPPVAIKSSHSIVTIQCHCGQQISVLKIPTISYPTFTGLILDIISFPLSFPTHFFSRFRFS